VSRTATRTAQCSTSSPFGRHCRCSARPFSSISSISDRDHPCATAGEMLCKCYIVLARSCSADRSPSQFKASYPSCTPSFDHSVTLPRPRSRMTALPTSYSLLLAGVAFSFGSLLCVILPEPPYGQILHLSSLAHLFRQLMNIGLLYTPVSIYQMTRGSLVLFVGVLSVLFLHRHLWLYQFRPSPAIQSSTLPADQPTDGFPYSLLS
jgi:hypothetical protein